MTRPHVLLTRLDNAGDVLLAGPAVRAVQGGARRVTFLAGPGGRAAADLLPGVDEVMVFDAPWSGYTPPTVDAQAIQRLVQTITALAIDEAVVLTSFHQSPLPLALLLRLAGVGRVGAASVDYPGSLLDVRHHVDEHVHEVERALSIVGSLGYRLPAGDDARLALRRPLPTWRPFDKPYVVVHPGASVPARAWGPDRHRVLVEALVASGLRVAVSGTAQERALTAVVAGAHGGDVVDLGGRTDLAGLAGVLEGASALVCGNTGPAHLAAAVGTPVVSLFAPVVPATSWRPWGVPVVVLGDQAITCAGCRSRICPLADHPCLAGVAVADVLAALETLGVDGVSDRPLEMPPQGARRRAEMEMAT